MSEITKQQNKIESTRKQFINELINQAGLYYRIYDNYFIRLGQHNKYFIEGYFVIDKTDTVKSILSNTEYKVYFISINRILKKEGVMIPDGAKLSINSRPNEFISAIIPSLMQNSTDKCNILIKQ
jgi:hypothetical protein